jgi:hypothetical protein
MRTRARMKLQKLRSRARRVRGLPKSFTSVKTCANPIFVVGSPRSGTTFLGWSLAHHSWLWTSGESTVIREIFGDTTPIERALEHAAIAGKGSWLTDQGVDRGELLAHLGIGVNALYTSRSRGRRWLDHTPQHAPVVDLIGDMFPGAVFLHLLRDGRQVVHSMTNFMNALPQERRESFERAGWQVPWLDFEIACETWRDYVEAATSFAAADTERCLTILHSRFVSEPWKAYRDVFRFLEIPFEPGPVAYVRVKRINSSFPSAALGEYGNPWPEWTTKQRQTFVRIAGETMVRCGLATHEELATPAEPVEVEAEGARA